MSSFFPPWSVVVSDNTAPRWTDVVTVKTNQNKRRCDMPRTIEQSPSDYPSVKAPLDISIFIAPFACVTRLYISVVFPIHFLIALLLYFQLPKLVTEALYMISFTQYITNYCATEPQWKRGHRQMLFLWINGGGQEQGTVSWQSWYLIYIIKIMHLNYSLDSWDVTGTGLWWIILQRKYKHELLIWGYWHVSWE